jgi:hypothetical protein
VRALLVLLEIVAVSAPLTWLWIVWGRDAYGELFLELALPIYGLLGLTDLVPIGARDRFINYLPFLILMIVTPRLSLRRRVVGTAVGFVVIFCVHLVFVYVASSAAEAGGPRTPRGFLQIVPANTLSDAVPFALWVVIAREFVWEHVARVFGGSEAAAPPAPGVESGREGPG